MARRAAKKGPLTTTAPPDDASVTGAPKLDGIYGAMVILTSDLSIDDQIVLARTVFQDLVILSVYSSSFNVSVGHALMSANNAMAYVDGTTPLGALAAQNAAQQVKAAHRDIHHVAKLLGIV